MNQSKISVRYAKAIFETAIEKNILHDVFVDLNLISKTISENQDFYSVISSPIIKPSEKLALMSNVFKSSVSEITMSFIGLLITNNRETYISDIVRVFSVLYRKEKNIKEVVLTTPTGLNSDIKERLISVVAESTKSNVEIKENLNPEMIGGVVIRIDNLQLDLSIATQLREIKESLKSDSFTKKI
jgi:F-type H+-transporting ATPase subunit delta